MAPFQSRSYYQIFNVALIAKAGNESCTATRLKEMNGDTLFSAMVYIPHLPSTITINKSKNAQETLARFSKLDWHKTLQDCLSQATHWYMHKHDYHSEKSR